jgi:Putative polyhydroxyalkanoic acid system protein (PHA_gran_rgn)
MALMALDVRHFEPACRWQAKRRIALRNSLSSFSSSALPPRRVYSVRSGKDIMKVTVSHSRSKEEVKQAVDRSFEDVFKSISTMPVQLAQEQRTWVGDTLNFSLVAKLGFMNAPIKGAIEVTDHEVIINVDLGMLENLISAEKVRDGVSDRVKGLLN